MNPKWDFGLILPILAMAIVSLLCLLSVDRQLAANQLIFWAIGLTLFAAISLLDIEAISKVSWPFYFLTIAALILVELIAQPIRGSTRWIDLGIFRIQPSELAKVSLILLLPSFFASKVKANTKYIMQSALISLPLVVLVFIQPDIGNALAIAVIWVGVALANRIPARYLILFTFTTILSMALLFNFLADYQKARIHSFIDPSSDPLGTGYNITQAKIAVGSGQLFGKGLGHGSQSQLNFLPEAESDFIFATVSEQLGLLGATFLLLCYLLLLSKILKYSRNLDYKGKLTMVGVLSFLIFQITVNVGMNVGIMPITGITLPLVSYGGSSLLTTLMLLGTVVSLKRSSSAFS